MTAYTADEERDIRYMMEHWGYSRERAEYGLELGEQGDIWTEQLERQLDDYLSSLE